jgi:hypothetical protein
MRAVREMVKTYRQADKPAAPAGLAARTARIALEEARRGGGDAPRRQLQTPVPREQRESRERSPAAVNPVFPGQKKSPGWGERPTAADLDREFARLKEEVLREIPKGWRTWLFHPAWTVAASVIFICALLIHFSPRLNQVETRFLPSMPLTRDDDVVRRIRERERLPASQPRQMDEAVPGAAGAAPILQEAAVINAMPEVLVAIPPAVVPAATSATAPVQAETPAPPEESPAPDSGDSHPELPSGPTPIEILESLGEKTRALAANDDSRVVVLDALDAAGAPQLIERLPAYDPAERIQSLITLAGMQMATGEFVDAWQTVGLLERYDADAAAALGVTLRDLELAAKAKEASKEKEEEAAPPPEPEPEPEPVPEQKPEPVPEPAPEPESEPAPEPESVPSAEEAAPEASAPEYAPYLEPLEPLDPPEAPPLSFVRVPVPESAPVPPPDAWLRSGSGESVYVDTPVAPGTGDALSSVIRNGESAIVSQDVPEIREESPMIIPPAAAYMPVPMVPVVIVPAPVPPPSQYVRPPPTPGRRPFTTDPYFRDY